MRNSIVLTLACLALYAAIAFRLPPRAYITSDQGVNDLQARRLASAGQVDIPIGPLLAPVLDEYFPWRQEFTPPGPILDYGQFLGSPLAPQGGRFLLTYPMGFAWLMSAMLKVGGDAAMLAIPVLSGGLAVLATFMLALRLGCARPWLAATIAGLASPLPVYSVLLWGHAPATAAVMLALLALLEPGPDASATPALTSRASRGFMAGLALGAGAAMRNEAVLAAGLLAVLFPLFAGRKGARAFLALIAGIALLVAPGIAYTYHTFGTLTNPAQASRAAGFAPHLDGSQSPARGLMRGIGGRLESIEAGLCESFFTSENLTAPAASVYIWCSLFALALLSVVLWAPASWRHDFPPLGVRDPATQACTAAGDVTLPHQDARSLATRMGGAMLVGLSILYLGFALLQRPQHVPGLFLCAPAMLLAVPALFSPIAWAPGPARRWLATATTLFILACALRGSGGWQWGPRYMLLVLPILAVWAVQAAEAFERSTLCPGALRLHLFALIAAGGGMTSIAMADLGLWERWLVDVEQTAVTRCDPAAVAFDYWWFSWENSPMIDRREFFYLSRPGQVRALVRHLASHGVTRLVLVSRSAAVRVDDDAAGAREAGATVVWRQDEHLSFGHEWHALCLEWPAASAAPARP